MQGLLAASACSAPPGLGATRARGAKAQGLRYERLLARALPLATHGQWYQFRDRAGWGWCQPDLVLDRGPLGLLVLEAKYSWVAEGHSQIELLYKPVLEMAHGRACAGLVVCRRLVAGMPRDLVVVGSLDEAVLNVTAGRRVVWHWLGTSAPGPLPWTRGKSHASVLGAEEMGL